MEQVPLAAKVVNSWWYLRKAYGHSARAVYAPVYDLPPDLGRYDVSIFGSILLHLRDPFTALEQAASVTDDTIVVVDRLVVPAEDIDRPVLFWNPTQSANPNGWWLLPPGVVTDMLDVLGFPNATVSYHRQYYRPESAPELADEVVFYTVVAPAGAHHGVLGSLVGTSGRAQGLRSPSPARGHARPRNARRSVAGLSLLAFAVVVLSPVVPPSGSSAAAATGPDVH